MAAGKEAAGPGWRVRRLEGRADMERAAALVAADLRPADVRELWAAGGHAPAEAVRASLAASRKPRGRAWAVLIHESILLLKLSNFKSGAAVISPEKRGFQAHSARAAAPAAAGALALFNSKPLECPQAPRAQASTGPESGRKAAKPRTGTGDERCVLLFGVAPLSLMSDTGVPWMLATRDWDAFMDAGLNLIFARRCRACLAEMGRDFARLENRVHAANRRAARWLAWMGFRLDPPAPWGVRKEMFMRFWKEYRHAPVAGGRPGELG